jgi:hypothetical protein
VSRHGGNYALWGFVRPAGGATELTVEAQRRGSHRYTTLAHVHTNSRGYWTLSSNVAASNWRVRWTSPEGVSYKGPPIRAY